MCAKISTDVTPHVTDETPGSGRQSRVISEPVPPPTGPLDAELDELFRQPPAAHVEARDALATKLRKAGDRASAERVKKLKRPSPPAWAINQLCFQKPELLEAAQNDDGSG